MPGRRTPRSARQPRPPPPNLPIPFRRATAATRTPTTTAVPATATATSSRHRHSTSSWPPARPGATKGETMTTAAGRRSGYVLAALAAIAAAGTVVAVARPGHPTGHAFPPLDPAAAPTGWPRAALPGGTAVLSYPPSL